MMKILKNYSPEQSFTFSIITPLYNRLDFLETWLKSLLEQEHHEPTEVLLINDASTEFIREDIEKIFQTYSTEIEKHFYTFFYLENEQNVGEYASTNKAAALANGTWLYIFHDDDLLLKNIFLEFTAIIKEFPQADLMTGRFYHIDEQGKIIEKSPDLAPEGFVDHKFRELFLSANLIHPVCTLYRKNIWEKFGGLNLQLDHAGDWEMLRRLTQVSLNWYYIPRYLCSYRIHQNQKSARYQNHPAGEYLWKILELGKKYYDTAALEKSKIYQYQHLFQIVDSHFQRGEFAQGCAILLDIIKFSDLGDRLWLDTLEKMSIEYKQIIQQTIEELIHKPYEI